MLPTHGRYEYSNITTRPDYAWPGGHRLAVYVALNIEAFGFGIGKGAAVAPPDQAQGHSVYSWRDYGNRVGIWRLFELLDELGIPAEAQMNTAIYETAPDIPGGGSGWRAHGSGKKTGAGPPSFAVGQRRATTRSTCRTRSDGWSSGTG